ncbi:MAG TPA: universal stress protein [Solirubrobacteraceae bacterium]|nr:universal stress protein [Solirubrobacteraceae bacterium]
MTYTMFAENEASAEPASSFDVGTDNPATFKSVLVGVDGTSTGRDAIALAAKLCDADGRLTLAHVVLVPQPVYGNFSSTGAGKQARGMLEREREAAGVSAELTGMFAASVGSGLHQLAADTGADLLVVGSCSRRPIARLLRGDDTRAALSAAACPVAVAPPGYAERSKPLDTIGVAYDGSPESEIALIAARVLAARHRAVPRALTAVWPTTSGVWSWGRTPLGRAWGAMMIDAFEREASERLASLTGVDGRVTVGPPTDELLAFADEVDLLVVGSRGHGPLRRLLLGGTSAYLARTAPCPLLVLPRGSRLRNRPGDPPRDDALV